MNNDRFKTVCLLLVSFVISWLTCVNQVSADRPIPPEILKTMEQIQENYEKAGLCVPPADFLPEKAFPQMDFASQGLTLISVEMADSAEMGSSRPWAPGKDFKTWRITVQDTNSKIKATIHLVLADDPDKTEELCDEQPWVEVQSGSHCGDYGVYRSLNPRSYKPDDQSYNEYERAFSWWRAANWMVLVVVPIQEERRRFGLERGVIPEEEIRERIRDILCAQFKKQGGRRVRTAKEFRRASRVGRPWNSAALDTPYQHNISGDEKIAGLSKFWSEVKYNFAYFDHVPALDWDRVFLDYLPKVRRTKSTVEYYRVLMEMCALLKDAHTNVYPPEQLEDEFYARPPMRTALVEDRVLITGVDSDNLRHEGIQPGLEIVRIDGAPVRQYAEQRVIPYLSSSTKQDLDVRAYSYFLLAGPKDKPVKLELQDDKGNVLKKSVPRRSYKPREVPPFEFKILSGNVAYVALNSFAGDSVVKSFDAAFNAIAQTDALILDVRDNGGGNSGVGWDILGYLTDKPFKTSQWKTREYRPAFRAWAQKPGWYSQPFPDWKPNGKKLYSKPVVVLTSARTFSAAEDFCVAFDYMKRGKIIGEPTGGSTGQPVSFRLPGGGSARVCAKRDSYPDGKEFVGVGVLPDIVVHPTVADVRAGQDTVLEAALEFLRKNKRGGSK